MSLFERIRGRWRTCFQTGHRVRVGRLLGSCRLVWSACSSLASSRRVWCPFGCRMRWTLFEWWCLSCLYFPQFRYCWMPCLLSRSIFARTVSSSIVLSPECFVGVCISIIHIRWGSVYPWLITTNACNTSQSSSWAIANVSLFVAVVKNPTGQISCLLRMFPAVKLFQVCSRSLNFVDSDLGAAFDIMFREQSTVFELFSSHCQDPS